MGRGDNESLYGRGLLDHQATATGLAIGYGDLKTLHKMARDMVKVLTR